MRMQEVIKVVKHTSDVEVGKIERRSNLRIINIRMSMIIFK